MAVTLGGGSLFLLSAEARATGSASMPSARRFPPPRTIEEHNDAYFHRPRQEWTGRTQPRKRS
jgi:hypothetical protein